MVALLLALKRIGILECLLYEFGIIGADLGDDSRKKRFDRRRGRLVVTSVRHRTSLSVASLPFPAIRFHLNYLKERTGAVASHFFRPLCCSVHRAGRS